jgi:hypothetical protein
MKVLGILTAAAAAFMLSFAWPASATTANVVPNPGFEQSGCGNTPVLCGWASTDPNTPISQDTVNVHTGSASMRLDCPSPFCDFLTGGAASASTDPASCVPIGPGAHAASFWYEAAATEVALGAEFYSTPDCSGPSSSAGLDAAPLGGGWQQVTGALAAPPGTQSARFALSIGGGCHGGCEDPDPCYCGISANFDDVEVEDVGDTSPPSISSFSPTSGQADAWVTITGTDFTGATTVAFDGKTTLNFDVVSSTEIVAFVPPAATSGPISVATPFGTGTSSDSFTVTPSPPGICCFEPTSGPVGTSVEIMGSNLTGATSVAFNGTAAQDFVVNSSTDVTTVVPPGATTGTISVSTPGGTAVSGGSFTVTASPPAISSFSPTSGLVGTSVDIQGSGFTGATSVTFNGTSDLTFVVNSSTDISAHVPTGATTGLISVTTPSGTATSSSSFTVPQPPAIAGFSPASGHVGQQVTITGSNFAGATGVELGTTSARFTINSPTRITATVPSVAHGYYRWSLTSPAGTATGNTYFHVR